MDWIEEIYKTIEVIVEKHFAKMKISQQVAGVVLGASGKNDGRYIVQINGTKYTLKDGVNIQPTPNSGVWVCVPNGNWNQAYICAKK